MDAGGDTPLMSSGVLIKDLEAENVAAARNLEFERAARLRDQIMSLKGSQGRRLLSHSLID